MKLNEVPFGSLVEVDYQQPYTDNTFCKIQGCVVGTYTGYASDIWVCLGWKSLLDKPKQVVGHSLSNRGVSNSYRYIDNLNDYVVLEWIKAHTICNYLYNDPNQKCFGCKKIASHAPPNQKDGTYICVSCKFVSEMI